MILPASQTPHTADGRLAHWLFSNPPAAAAFQSMLTEGTIDPASVFVAVRADDSITGVLLTSDLGGGQVDVKLPRSDADDTADELLIHAVLHWRSRGAKVLQCIPRATTAPQSQALHRTGFRPVTDLLFYDRALTDADTTTPSVAIRLRSVARDDLAFAELLLATYDGSADVPELNNTRSAPEILASYQDATTLNPPPWYAITVEGQPVGVLVLNVESGAVFELSYMGVIPSVRGHGYGRQIAAVAVSVCAGNGGTRLHLSADVRNTSAHRIYTQLGFEVVERRAVWLLI